MKHIIQFATVFLLLTGCGNTNKEGSTSEEQGDERGIMVTQDQFDANNLTLGTMEKRTFPKMVETSGMIDVPPENRASVMAFMGGFVKKTSLLIGDRVKKGQLLVTLENQEFVQMQQEYLEVFNQLDFLKAEFERNQTLFDEKIASQKNFLQAKSNYETAKARYQGLREQLQMLNISPSKVEQGQISPEAAIYAPISGSITQMNVARGSYVSPATKILEIVDNSHVHLELTVFEKDILKVKKGQKIQFKIPEASEEAFNAEVHLVGASIDGAKRTIQVHGHLEREDGNFLPGMFVDAMIMTDTVKTWSLPEEAVIESEGSHFVLKLVRKEDGGYTFERVAVKQGNTFDGHTEIIGTEWSETDQFLTKGVFDLIGG
ncbi:efflux RND transporter periplasmic adaptor subunit [Allomuricauda taeanensis]|jgi:cobalt-zinc-cadmium efflux system membrane fusion protein|uniref:efflux RND transporter periplasmic adaptor subunit n=1 Tax=Flagellimonas taeanensis TaxID=1005926 RepID=UPI002E7AD1E2|nr:efflux RND transporter periplasmic adaptor subunit [Allomuricauda taeanensis]MEE1961807.1 efflux RND transporter periplasmic adaptor subunit [Allomuricauda taeanensis]